MIVVSALSLVGCGGGGGTDSTVSGSSAGMGGAAAADEGTAGADVVTISDFEYSPATIAVPAGTTLEITNEDSAPHTVTSKKSGAFDSGTIAKGETAEIKLEEPGTYAYFCSFHPFMKGTIQVE